MPRVSPPIIPRIRPCSLGVPVTDIDIAQTTKNSNGTAAPSRPPKNFKVGSIVTPLHQTVQRNVPEPRLADSVKEDKCQWSEEGSQKTTGQLQKEGQ
jgi:hypothetical protein